MRKCRAHKSGIPIAQAQKLGAASPDARRDFCYQARRAAGKATGHEERRGPIDAAAIKKVVAPLRSKWAAGQLHSDSCSTPAITRSGTQLQTAIRAARLALAAACLLLHATARQRQTATQAVENFTKLTEPGRAAQQAAADDTAAAGTEAPPTQTAALALSGLCQSASRTRRTCRPGGRGAHRPAHPD